jgi:hypothetical protein
MLHKALLLKELEAVAHELFKDVSSEIAVARLVWNQAINDPELSEKIAAFDAPWALPTWQGKLDANIPISPCNSSYQLVSIDGSQIYPDKHQGTSCFLINIGIVELQYGTGKKGITVQSIPYVFTDSSNRTQEEPSPSVDFVNCKREELELQYGFEYAKKLQEEIKAPLLLLFDGSLLFWHLESKDAVFKKYFMNRYVDVLEKCKEQGILIAGYMSLPKHKELMGILKSVMCRFNSTSKAYQEIDRLTDATITRFFLESGTRSTLFKSTQAITELYPADVAPYFCYFNVGVETVRIEVPEYIATNELLFNKMCGIIIDQSQKGTGFPVGLSEAHEQAVVRGADRDFFYYLINKMGLTHKKMLVFSQKVRKKRNIPI